jgi:hypothetical protein
MSESVKKKLFLFTSDIAAFIGQNEYDFVTPFERLWKRCDPDGYNTIINENKTQLLSQNLEIIDLEKEKDVLKTDLDTKKITKRQYTLRSNKIDKRLSELKVKSDCLEKMIDDIDLNQEQRLKKTLGEENIRLVQSETIETDDKRENIKNSIKKMDISDKQKQTLLKESESFINRTHGTLKEESAIVIYEKRFDVKLDTSQEFFKKRIECNSNSNFDWYIGGRIDGLYIDKQDKNKSYIVEVKNRTRGFFTALRDYEKTQIHIYMHMLSIPMAKLVEKFNDQIRITVIYQDDDYLNDILYYLSIFAVNFESKFLNQEKLKIDFVNSDRVQKQMIIRKLYLNEIRKRVNEKLESNLKDDLDDDQDCLISDDL